MTSRSQGRGRPRAGDPTAISRTALIEIDSGGWAGTTMAAIAQRSGVSEPTLFRYFPTKADLLWHGMDESATAFRERVALRADGQPVVAAIVDGYTEMLLADRDRLSLIRQRAAIIARDTAAAEASWRKFEEWRGIVTEMLRERMPEAGGIETAVRGAMIWSALWTALTSWATSRDATPAAHLAAARTLLTSGA